MQVLTSTLRNSQIFDIPTSQHFSSLTIFFFSNLDLASLYTTWLTTVLTRAFNHESKFITKWAVETSLQLDVKKLGLLTNDLRDFITGPLLNALGENYLYEKSTSDDPAQPPILAVELKKFLERSRNSAEENYRKEFFKEVCYVIKYVLSSLLDVV